MFNNSITQYISNYPLRDVAEKMLSGSVLSFAIGAFGSILCIGTPMLGILNLSFSLVANVIQEITQPLFENLFADPDHPGTMTMLESLIKKTFVLTIAISIVYTAVLGPQGAVFAIATLIVNIVVNLIIYLPDLDQRIPLQHRNTFVII